MPVRVKQTEAKGHAGGFEFHRGQGLLRLLLHLALDTLALTIQAIQLTGHLTGRGQVIAEQALNPQTHVIQPAGGIQPWPENKTQITTGQPLGTASGHVQQCRNPRTATASTNARQPLVHQNAVIGIQRHHIRHGTQGHQIKQLPQIRLGARGKIALFTQMCPKRQHDIENHPDPGNTLAGKVTARLIRIDDGIGHRQLLGGQMVIGHHHLQTGGLGRCNPLDTGNAVIHGNQYIRMVALGNGNNFRRQAVTEFKAIGHQVLDPGRAQRA